MSDNAAENHVPAAAPAAMPKPGRLVFALGLTCAVAAGLLAFSYELTREAIDRQEAQARAESLRSIFFAAVDDAGATTLREEDLGLKNPAFALYRPSETRPAYYAVLGRGAGYNAGSPIEMMVGFTNPGHPDDTRSLLGAYVSEDLLPPAGVREARIVGFRVTKSEETPGLGEKIKDNRPPYTWAEKLGGQPAVRSGHPADRATDFQRQFRGKAAESLAVGQNVDAITAATITTNGVIRALRDASSQLREILADKDAESK